MNIDFLPGQKQDENKQVQNDLSFFAKKSRYLSKTRECTLYRLYLFYLLRQSITKNPFFESIFDDNGALIVSFFFILTFKKRREYIEKED